MTRRWYWKLYLFLMASLTVGGIGLSIYYFDEATSIDRVVEWVSLPMYLVQLLGLFGFINWRRFASPRLWQFVFAATVLELLWVVYSMAADTALFSDADTMFLVIMGAAGAGIQLPLLAALYIYAFRSEDLWAKAT